MTEQEEIITFDWISSLWWEVKHMTQIARVNRMADGEPINKEYDNNLKINPL